MNLTRKVSRIKFRIIYLYALIFVTCFLPSPFILSDWESLTYFATFASEKASFDAIYPVRANVGGQGYWSLDLSRNIIEALDLSFSFTSIRLPSIFLGAIALYIFFKICNKYTNSWSSFVITFLLATNPTFHYFQNSLIII